MRNFATLMGIEHTFPLMTTQRCGRAITLEAQKIVPEFKCADRVSNGLVQQISDIPDELLIPGESMILCRMNASLITEFYRLAGRGVRAIIKGRDFASSSSMTVEPDLASEPTGGGISIDLRLILFSLISTKRQRDKL